MKLILFTDVDSVRVDTFSGTDDQNSPVTLTALFVRTNDQKEYGPFLRIFADGATHREKYLEQIFSHYWGHAIAGKTEKE